VESNRSFDPQRQLAELDQIEQETWFPPPTTPVEPVEQPPLWNWLRGVIVVLGLCVGFIATWSWLRVRTDEAWWVFFGGIAVVSAVFVLVRRSEAKQSGVKHPVVPPRPVLTKLLHQMWPIAVGCGLMPFALGQAVNRAADWWVYAAIVAAYFAIAIPLQTIVAKKYQAGAAS